MNEQELLAKVAEQYRQEGYDVKVHPGAADLPSSVPDGGIDLLARRGDEFVAVRVKTRDELYDLEPLAEAVRAVPGWRYDLVVAPQNGSDDLPPDGAEQGPGYIESLLAEADHLLGTQAARGAFLIAWSAIEAAMRAAARREGVAVGNDPPRLLVKTTYANGIISREDFERLERCLEVRNSLVHGVQTNRLETDDTKFLVAAARRLLDNNQVQVE